MNVACSGFRKLLFVCNFIHHCRVHLLDIEGYNRICDMTKIQFGNAGIVYNRDLNAYFSGF